ALLILAVLGTIYLGLAPPTEAAAMGAFAMLLLTLAWSTKIAGAKGGLK
ncbi:unnamed protein product, partial [marine sediment metagenome]